jgi:predicted O-methyltransferase YrrM
VKPALLPPFEEIFDHYQPLRICEIGTHCGKSANQFVRYILQTVPNLRYVGYDAFEDVKDDIEFAKQERNGKKHGVKRQAMKYLEDNKAKHPGFSYKLVQGLTQDTLKEASYDFVYIDGGHSYETVKHDYEKVKHSSVIVFDDYNLPGVSQFVDELFEELGYPKVEWKEAFTSPRPCTSVLPIIGKHVQPVIFNR